MNKKLDPHRVYLAWDNGAFTEHAKCNVETRPDRPGQIALYQRSGNWDVYELLDRQPDDKKNVHRPGRYLRTDYCGG